MSENLLPTTDPRVEGVFFISSCRFCIEWAMFLALSSAPQLSFENCDLKVRMYGERLRYTSNREKLASISFLVSREYSRNRAVLIIRATASVMPRQPPKKTGPETIAKTVVL